MSGIVWTKFFWADWANDPALQLCSFAAQGLWMRMLCIASAHDPIGYVAVAGRGLSETNLARLTGGSESEVASLLGELDRNGVFSRDRHGRIYSRRMVRDARKAAEARKFGHQGGNPKLKGGYNKPGFVYLMGARSDGAYKIGISNNPTNRLKKVRDQYPGQNISVIDAWRVDNMGDVESEVQSMFTHKVASGEWFFLDSVDIGKIRDFFQTLKGPVKGGQKAQEPRAKSQPPSGIVLDKVELLIERLKAIYPRRNHAHPWSKAKPIFAKQLRDGACPDDICRAAEAYAAKVRREGKEGTEFVKQITSFAAYWQDVLADQPQPRKLDPGWPLSWDRETCRRLYLAGSWPPGIGCPPPGEPGCKIPAEVQAEWAKERQRAA